MLEKADVERTREAIRWHKVSLLRYPNVFGCGVGRRQVGGRKTDEASIVVFVERKIPKEYLREDELLPREVATRDGRVPVDVIESPVPKFGIDTDQYRPVRGGCMIRIGPVPGGYGTGGGILYDRRDAAIVVLTCNHVLTLPGQRDQIPSNPLVGQPTVTQPIGRTRRIVPWLPAPFGDSVKLQATVDAGIASLDPRIQSQFRILDVGKHPFAPLPPSIDLAVIKRGATSELTSGTVEQVDITAVLRDDNGDLVRFGDEEAIFSVRSEPDSIFFQRGDSGSLVVDADGAGARGMLYSGTFMPGGLSWACDLGTVMAQLELETPLTGMFKAAFQRALRRRQMIGMVDEATTIRAGAEDSWTLDRFGAGLVKTEVEGTLVAALKKSFDRLAPEFAEAFALDEDFAGLMDLAIGDWLVQPTVFDMLEYRIPKDMSERIGTALERFGKINPGATGYEWIPRALHQCGGIRVRDLLERAAPKPEKENHRKRVAPAA